MVKKPILTMEDPDGVGPDRTPDVTRPGTPVKASTVTRPVADTSGRDASGHVRPRTRILGHGTDVPDEEAAIAPVVGWLVVTAGPGRGAAMELIAGMNAVGRGEDNHVQVDFGDNAISREAHAYVSYDHEARDFHLSHGGKTNLVRRNGAPVLAVESLHHGDTVRIGATSLRFVALCGPEFDWADAVEGA